MSETSLILYLKPNFKKRSQTTNPTDLILINSHFTTDEHLKKCMTPHNQKKSDTKPIN